MKPPYGRRDSMDKIHALLVDRQKWGMFLAEIGSTRERGNWNGDGYSTPFFAWIAECTDSYFYSCDARRESTDTARGILEEYGLGQKKDAKGTSHVNLVTMDGLRFLRLWRNSGVKIDLLYLDGWDWTPETAADSEKCHLDAAIIALPCIARGGLIVIDDVIDTETWKGKGALAIPFLLSAGYEVLHKGYQTILTKGASCSPDSKAS